jgi:hypothetical protein
MPVTKKQKLNDNRVMLKKQRRPDPGLPIGGLPPGDWEIVYLEDINVHDLSRVLEEDDARARETARRVIPLLPSTTPSFSHSSSSSSLQQGVKRKARPREDDIIIDNDSGSDSSFALTTSSSSRRGKRTSKKKKKKKKRSSGNSSTRRRTASVAVASSARTVNLRRGVRPFTPEPGRVYRFNCDFDLSECKYATDTKSSFNNHMDIHNDVRYGCPECKMTFTQKSHVSTHIRIVHRGQKKPKPSKKFPCQRTGCGKMFRDNRVQNEHFDFHPDNNPWTCPSIN